jgi:hypothetical protein
MSASEDEAGIDTPTFTRSPVDRLLLGCILAASLAYVVFLVVMQWLPAEPEAGPRQGYLGVVSNESQPGGLGGGEDDPATGVAERAGVRPGYYIGNGQAPRPVELSEAEGDVEGGEKRAPVLVPATRVEPGASLGRSGLGTLGLDELIVAGLETKLAVQLERLSAPGQRDLPAPAPSPCVP